MIEYDPKRVQLTSLSDEAFSRSFRREPTTVVQSQLLLQRGESW